MPNVSCLLVMIQQCALVNKNAIESKTEKPPLAFTLSVCVCSFFSALFLSISSSSRRLVVYFRFGCVHQSIIHNVRYIFMGDQQLVLRRLMRFAIWIRLKFLSLSPFSVSTINSRPLTAAYTNELSTNTVLIINWSSIDDIVCGKSERMVETNTNKPKRNPTGRPGKYML